VAELVVRRELQGGLLHGSLSAGEDVIAPFLTDRKQFLEDVVQPLQNKPETIYVVQIPTPKNTWRGAIHIRKQSEWATDWPGKAPFAAFCVDCHLYFNGADPKGWTPPITSRSRATKN